MPNPWLICTVEGCASYGLRYSTHPQFRFCTDCGSERAGTLPRCCAKESLSDRGFCGACGMKKASL